MIQFWLLNFQKKTLLGKKFLHLEKKIARKKVIQKKLPEKNPEISGIYLFFCVGKATKKLPEKNTRKKV